MLVICVFYLPDHPSAVTTGPTARLLMASLVVPIAMITTIRVKATAPISVTTENAYVH